MRAAAILEGAIRDLDATDEIVHALPWVEIKPPKRSELFAGAVNTLMTYSPEKAAEVVVLNPLMDVSPRITLDDMRSLVAVLDAGGVEGKHTIIIDHDTAKFFAVLRHDMENVEL